MTKGWEEKKEGGRTQQVCHHGSSFNIYPFKSIYSHLFYVFIVVLVVIFACRRGRSLVRRKDMVKEHMSEIEGPSRRGRPL